MFGETHPKKRLLLALLVMMALPACITVQAIEPVIEPPSFYQGDVTVPVEFVPPPMVGMRCAERGAKFLGLPGFNAGACGDNRLVTMPDPCMTFTAGAFAGALCTQYEAALEIDRSARAAEINKADMTWGAALSNAAWTPGEGNVSLVKAGLVSKPSAPPASLATDTRMVPVEFAAPDYIEYRCAERGAKFLDDRGAGIIACADAELVTISNPCALDDGGWYARTLCHEMAHANGWPSDHSRRPPLPKASESAEAIRWRAAEAKRAEATELPAGIRPEPATPEVPSAERLTGEPETLEAQYAGQEAVKPERAHGAQGHRGVPQIMARIVEAEALPATDEKEPDAPPRTMMVYAVSGRPAMFNWSYLLAR